MIFLLKDSLHYKAILSQLCISEAFSFCVLLTKVYDLRFGRYQAPLSTVVDPSFLATVGPMQRIMVASQSGAFQTLEFEAPNLDPESMGNIMLDCYDRIVSFCVSSKYVFLCPKPF